MAVYAAKSRKLWRNNVGGRGQVYIKQRWNIAATRGRRPTSLCGEIEFQSPLGGYFVKDTRPDVSRPERNGAAAAEGNPAESRRTQRTSHQLSTIYPNTFSRSIPGISFSNIAMFARDATLRFIRTASLETDRA